MRWISLATVLGAALLPAASARPLCRPDRSTTSGLPSTTATTTSIAETLATDTASVTASQITVETSATYETTTDIEITITESATGETTTAFETTITESATVTASDFTTETTATTAETTVIDATTTITEAAEPTNVIQNPGFEDLLNTDWGFRSAQIKSHSDTNPNFAATGDKYVEFDVTDFYATGGNQVNQTINGLETDRLYRFSFSSTVFSHPMPVIGSDTVCVVEALQDSTQISQWQLDFSSLDQYMSYHYDFTPADEDFTLSMRLRCTVNNKVTVAVGIDDVSLIDIGPKQN